ncbi:hypothetical protein J6590_020988 [Homalodisca vitripennis]|nr:hypothetical protein J6590_020988 [Homalodisca vitripennis]
MVRKSRLSLPRNIWSVGPGVLAQSKSDVTAAEIAVVETNSSKTLNFHHANVNELIHVTSVVISLSVDPPYQSVAPQSTVLLCRAWERARPEVVRSVSPFFRVDR